MTNDNHGGELWESLMPNMCQALRSGTQEQADMAEQVLMELAQFVDRQEKIIYGR